MPSCATIDPLVTPFVDGELTVEERALVERHLRECAPCRSRIAAERSVCELLHRRRPDLRATHAPVDLRGRCRPVQSGRGAVPLAPPATRPEWRTRVTGRASGLAVAALFLLAIGTAVAYRATVGATQAIAAELTADHVKCFMLNTVLQTHDSLAEVEAELQSGFDWTARLPEHPESAGMELVGSRPCLYEHGKIAHIMYRHHGVPVSVFMLPGTSQRGQLLQAFGHDAVVWSDAGRTFVLIAKAPRPEVEQVASFVQASLR